MIMSINSVDLCVDLFLTAPSPVAECPNCLWPVPLEHSLHCLWTFFHVKVPRQCNRMSPACMRRQQKRIQHRQFLNFRAFTLFGEDGEVMPEVKLFDDQLPGSGGSLCTRSPRNSANGTMFCLTLASSSASM